jgi:hypothetical protein
MLVGCVVDPETGDFYKVAFKKALQFEEYLTLDREFLALRQD